MTDLSDLLWLISSRPPPGFEPATLWLRDPRAKPLSYPRHTKYPPVQKKINPKTCSNMSKYAPICPNMPQYVFFEGSPFCHHEGPCKRWEFLNRCTFRFRSTPSFFFPTKQIGVGTDGPFCSSFELSNKKHIFCQNRRFWDHQKCKKKRYEKVQRP